MSSTTQGAPSSSSSAPVLDNESRAKLVHNVSLAALIGCPIIIMLPPRKFDVYTLALMTGTLLGGNQLLAEYTGRSMVARAKMRIQSMSGDVLPAKAREVQERLRREREARMEGAVRRTGGGAAAGEESGSGSGKILKEVERRREEERGKDKGLLEKVWMGGEGEDWKARRDQREKEALEEGRGYGGLIMDQIWEVWNWGRDKPDGGEDKDGKPVEESIAKNEGKK